MQVCFTFKLTGSLNILLPKCYGICVYSCNVVLLCGAYPAISVLVLKHFTSPEILRTFHHSDKISYTRAVCS